jgi:hypothetical protein
MLLFDFTRELSRTDWFIIAWMTSFFIDETKQVSATNSDPNMQDTLPFQLKLLVGK